MYLSFEYQVLRNTQNYVKLLTHEVTIFNISTDYYEAVLNLFLVHTLLEKP